MISLTLVALLVVSGDIPAVPTVFAPTGYLPLTVGNSWTYSHFALEANVNFMYAGSASEGAQAAQVGIILEPGEIDRRTVEVGTLAPGWKEGHSRLSWIEFKRWGC